MPVPPTYLSRHNYNTLKNYVVYLNDLMTSRFNTLRSYQFYRINQNYEFIAEVVEKRINVFNRFNNDWNLVEKDDLEDEIHNLHYILEFINKRLNLDTYDFLPQSLIREDSEPRDTTRVVVVPRLSLLQEDPTSPSRPYTPPSGPTSHWVPSSPTSRPYTGGYRKRKSRKSKKSRKSNKSRKSRK